MDKEVVDKELIALIDCSEIQDKRPTPTPGRYSEQRPSGGYGWCTSGVNIPEFDLKGNCWFNVNNERTLFVPDASWLLEEIASRLGITQSINFTGFPRFANDKESQDNFRASIWDRGRPKFPSKSKYYRFPEKALTCVLLWQIRRQKDEERKD